MKGERVNSKIKRQLAAGTGHGPKEGRQELPCPWLTGLGAWGASVQAIAGGWKVEPLR